MSKFPNPNKTVLVSDVIDALESAKSLNFISGTACDSIIKRLEVMEDRSIVTTPEGRIRVGVDPYRRQVLLTMSSLGPIRFRQLQLMSKLKKKKYWLTISLGYKEIL